MHSHTHPLLGILALSLLLTACGGTQTQTPESRIIQQNSDLYATSAKWGYYADFVNYGRIPYGAFSVESEPFSENSFELTINYKSIAQDGHNAPIIYPSKAIKNGSSITVEGLKDATCISPGTLWAKKFKATVAQDGRMDLDVYFYTCQSSGQWTYQTSRNIDLVRVPSF